MRRYHSVSYASILVLRKWKVVGINCYFLELIFVCFVPLIKDLSKSDTMLQSVSFLFVEWTVSRIFLIYHRRNELHF